MQQKTRLQVEFLEAWLDYRSAPTKNGRAGWGKPLVVGGVVLLAVLAGIGVTVS